jgi:hypothetical protein
MKWSFASWTGQVAATAGLLTFMPAPQGLAVPKRHVGVA